MKKILAISGSLRAESFNTTILRTVQKMMDAKAELTFYNGYDALPHFNPDLDTDPAPEAVTFFRNLLKEANGVVVCTPEYAFGLPGSLKNALDWTVSSGEFNEKPVAVISASPLPSGGEKAMAALLLVFSALGVHIAEGATLSIPGIKVKMDTHGAISDAQTLKDLESLTQVFLVSLRK